MASYGLTCNLSYTNNDGMLELGAHITDSEGLDVSAQAESDDATKLVDSLCADIMTGILEQSKEDEVEEEVDEIQRLKDENERLRARIEQLQNKTKETKSTNSVPKLTVDPKPKKDYYAKSIAIDEFMDKLDKILADSTSSPTTSKKTPKVAKVDKDDPFSWAKNVISADTGYWDTITGEHF